MIFIIYRAIVALAAILVLDALFRERNPGLKANAALVLIPLVLRALMIA